MLRQFLFCLACTLLLSCTADRFGLNTDAGDAGCPTLGEPCDGPEDEDLCEDGTVVDCADGEEICSDTTDEFLEVCDGMDNDCNPATEDGSGDPMLLTPCDDPEENGECEDGLMKCNAGTLFCDDPEGMGVDLCDDFDNDCNAETPDGTGDPAVGVACDSDGDKDLCENGRTVCNRGMILCEGDVPSDPEACDGMDNDCNPMTVDGAEDSRVGVNCDGGDADMCRDGTSLCQNGGIICNDPNDSVVEVCDNIDNDCDSRVDEELVDPRINVPCDGTDSDSCTNGVVLCRSGTPLCIEDAANNQVEICNNADDDCDNRIDEGIPGLGQACGGNVGACRQGTLMCQGGAVQCVGAVEGTPDNNCNNIDDDCDSRTDEAYVSTACMMNACAGNTRCVGGAEVCSTGQAEVCNGNDDDCDGQIDENDNGGTQELCFNNKDDDCDGQTDESCQACVTFAAAGKRVAVCDFPQNYDVSSDICLERFTNGRLVSFDTIQQTELVLGNPAVPGDTYWVGLRNADGTATGFMWSDMHPYNAAETNWDRNLVVPEPDNLDATRCVMGKPGPNNNTLRTRWCGDSYKFICEFDQN